MRIYEIITESSDSNRLNIKDVFGGGTLSQDFEKDSQGKIRSMSAVYKDKNGNIESEAISKNNRKIFKTKEDPTGQLMDVNEIQLFNMFNNYAAQNMARHANDKIATQDPNGDQVLDLSRKLNMKESNNNNQQIMSEIQSELKPFMDRLYATARQMMKDNEGEELDEASNGSMSAMPGKTYSPQPQNKALAKINAITKR